MWSIMNLKIIMISFPFVILQTVASKSSPSTYFHCTIHMANPHMFSFAKLGTNVKVMKDNLDNLHTDKKKIIDIPLPIRVYEKTTSKGTNTKSKFN